MKLKYRFETIKIEDEVVAVPVGREAENLNGIYKLNAEGEELFKLLSDETTIEDIVQYLTEKYEDNEETLRKYVHEFTDKLKKDGVLV